MATQYTAGLSAGQVLTAATMNSIGAEWESYTPTLTQPGAITKTVTYARYGRLQKFVFGSVYLSITGTGTGGNNIIVGAPVTARDSNQIVGAGFFYDASANNIYVISAALTTTTSFNFNSDLTGSSSAFGTTPNIPLGNNDQIRFSFVYEAA